MKFRRLLQTAPAHEVCRGALYARVPEITMAAQPRGYVVRGEIIFIGLVIVKWECQPYGSEAPGPRPPLLVSAASMTITLLGDSAPVIDRVIERVVKLTLHLTP